MPWDSLRALESIIGPALFVFELAKPGTQPRRDAENGSNRDSSEAAPLGPYYLTPGQKTDGEVRSTTSSIAR